MKFITIVAILGFSGHANAAIPAASTAEIVDEKIDRPLLRGSGMPEFFKDILHHLPTEIDNEDASFESGIKSFDPKKAAKGLTGSAQDMTNLATGYARLIRLGTLVENNVELALEEEKEVSSAVKKTALQLESKVASVLKDVLKADLRAIGGDTMYEDEEEEFMSEPMDLSFLDELIAKYEAKIPDNVDLKEVAFVGGALSRAASATSSALDTAAQATANAASVASKSTANAMGTASSATVSALDTAATATGNAMATATQATAAALKF